jgi:DNA-binding NtrC family response regulator
MMAARWPGNVRQLQNETKRLAVCASGPVIGEEEPSDEVAAENNNQLRAAKALGLSRQGLINKLNRYHLLDK